MIILRVRSVKKIRKNISSFLIVTILFSNLFPVLNVAFAEGEDASSPAPTQSVETAAPATADSSGNVSQTPQTQLTPLTAPTASLIPDQSMDTTTPSTSTGQAATTSNATNTLATDTTENNSDKNNSATDTSATTTIFFLPVPTTTNATGTPFNGTASSTNEFVTGGGGSVLGTSTSATSSEILGTTTVICDGSSTDPSNDGCDTYDMGTSSLPVGTTTIKTGDSAATANVLNLLNTNSLNSTGTIKMVNLTNGSNGDLDLRNNPSGPATDTCNLLSCSGVNSVTANITSDANIDNTLVLQAQTGTNTVGTVQNGVIDTGNAFAGLNLVNFANTNFIDSNYYLLSLNSFNTINGDIVLPGLATLFAKIAASALRNINSNQLAETQNNLDINANTGSNTVSNSLSSNTNTGDANSATNIYNNSNSNLIGGNSIQILLRVSGNWLGKLLGLPFGTNFVQDGNVRILLMDDGATSTTSGTMSDINSTSTAKIVNDVKMLSDTGNNLIANTENATINTGNAMAAANIINVSNTNVIGKNWMLAIINIFGDLNGNIVFGRPDLWVSNSVTSADTQINNGSVLSYVLTIQNKGDAPASNVKVTSQIPVANLDITNSSVTYTTDSSGNLVFDLGNMEPNISKAISFSATIKNATPGQVVTNTTSAQEDDSDNNLSDNTDSNSVTVYNPNPTVGDGGSGTQTTGTVGNNNNGQNTNTNTNTNTNPQITFVPNDLDKVQITSNNFRVIRETKEGTVTGSASTTHEKVILKNLSNNLIHNVIFNDLIYDPTGAQIQKENWEVGDLLPNDEIAFEYDVAFLDSSLPGTYTLASEIDYDPNIRIIFEHNGKINLQRELTRKKTEEDIAQNAATTTTLSSVNTKHPRGIIAPQKEDTNINFADFLSALTIPTAYADSADSTPNVIQADLLDSQNIYYTMMLIFSLMISSMYMFVEKNNGNLNILLASKNKSNFKN